MLGAVYLLNAFVLLLHIFIFIFDSRCRLSSYFSFLTRSDSRCRLSSNRECPCYSFSILIRFDARYCIYSNSIYLLPSFWILITSDNLEMPFALAAPIILIVNLIFLALLSVLSRLII